MALRSHRRHIVFAEEPTGCCCLPSFYFFSFIEKCDFAAQALDYVDAVRKQIA